MKNTSHSGKVVRRVATILATSALLGASLVACSNGSDAQKGNAADVEAALEKGGELTFWSWSPSAEKQVAKFKKAYPKVDVKVVNAGTNTTEYTKLQNVIKAGSGAPDVAQIEYYALPQFALNKSLVDLTAYGFGSLKEKFGPATWDSVAINDGIYGLPQDSGPMAMFYNKTVFDKHGITVPTKWDEFVAAGEKLHAADPTAYITSDSGDAGFATSMIWQAGGRPFETKGSDVAIRLQDEGTKKWTATWNKLVTGKLVSPVPGWSDDWFKSLGNGSIATLITGAWMPGVLEASVKDGAGQWRVAPIPTYDGTRANAANGGSADVVLKQSKNPALAAGFLKWLNNSDDSVNEFVASGGFPATVSALNAESFRSATPAYFGGQKINEVLVQAAKDVSDGFTYLPFQVFANSIFADTVGKSYANNSDLNPGLVAWQKALVDYGGQQGFTIKAE